MIEICGHRVLVKQEKLEDTDPIYAKAKAAGIKFAEHPDTVRERKAVDKGVVVGIGPTAWKDFGGTAWCNKGDTVYFTKYAGYLLTDPDTNEEYACMNDEDILAIVKRA